MDVRQAESTLDHYKLWQASAPEHKPTPVTLDGEFVPGWGATINKVEWIACPVEKQFQQHHVLRQHPSDHFLGYPVELAPGQPTPVRTVPLRNQFSLSARWAFDQPVFLLVPASKTLDHADPGAPSQELDHFLCFRVTETNGGQVRGTVTLNDQLDDYLGRRIEADRLDPAFFGVAVSKNGEEIHRSDVYLAVYTIMPEPPATSPLNAVARDQFGLKHIDATQSRLLAVPSVRAG